MGDKWMSGWWMWKLRGIDDALYIAISSSWRTHDHILCQEPGSSTRQNNITPIFTLILQRYLDTIFDQYLDRWQIHPKLKPWRLTYFNMATRIAKQRKAGGYIINAMTLCSFAYYFCQVSNVTVKSISRYWLLIGSMYIHQGPPRHLTPTLRLHQHPPPTSHRQIFLYHLYISISIISHWYSRCFAQGGGLVVGQFLEAVKSPVAKVWCWMCSNGS